MWKFHFGHKTSFLKSRFVKSRLYCSDVCVSVYLCRTIKMSRRDFLSWLFFWVIYTHFGIKERVFLTAAEVQRLLIKYTVTQL